MTRPRPILAKENVRQAQPADIPALEQIAYAVSSRKEPDYFERCLREQAEGRRTVLLASLDGENPAAYGMLNRWPNYIPFRRSGIFEIQDLNTAPPARRQNLASAIIRQCEAMARAEGCTHIGLGVGLYAGYGAAQRLYTRRGYLPDGAGVVYDSIPVVAGEVRPIDDDLNLMMVKAL